MVGFFTIGSIQSGIVDSVIIFALCICAIVIVIDDDTINQIYDRH